MIRPPSLMSQVLAFVLERGEVSVDEVLAGVGREISAAQAAAAGRRHQRHGRARHKTNRPPTQTIVDRGKRQVVLSCLSQLTANGKLRRVRRAIYAPPLPRLFNTA